MIKLIVLISSLWLASTKAVAWDFTSSNMDQEFCKDITNNLQEVGVSVSHKSMTQCSLQVLGSASATVERPYGGPVKVRVKSDPYRMLVTRGDDPIGTCYVLHPRKVTRKVKDWDC